MNKSNLMFELKEITLHGKTKYEIVHTIGGKHLCYMNDKTEATNVLRLLNKRM